MSQALRWGQPGAFYWLIAVAVLIIFYFVREKRGQSVLAQSFGRKVAEYLSQSVSFAARRVQLAIQVLGLVFIVVALARPQSGQTQQQIKSEGIELMVLADVSDSMLAEDVKPSRLEQMKIELAKLLELMPGNKIGIIAFAGSSALLSPLTSDPNALRMYIDSLDTDSVSTQGTNFETALSYAREAFEKGGATQDSGNRTTRVILVASDGEDQEKGALDTAKKLSSDGIKIYTMAYGTEKGGTIPMRDNLGYMTGYKRDESGQTVITQVHGDFLKSLADAGGGQFYFAQFNGDHLRRFVDSVSELEKTQFQSSFLMQYDEKFGWPLGIGLLLLWLSLFVSDRRSAQSEWKGKYES